ncbi:hypothetical protein LTR64_006053 [Lithohypha guttulata]|uniref:uncharacterized protein n=1 Tax=Lithohypha guttulata TaxID=1690604 RepID=UPI002DDFB5D9|nr:hypothetical protein LTR51_002149 [Lithohypha guttulata]
MAQQHQDDERTHLLPTSFDRRRSRLLSVAAEVDGASIASSHVSKEELALGETAVGERLPYNDYTTIDWLHDLVKDSFRYRTIRSKPGLRYRLLVLWDSAEGWVASALIGTLTACVAFLVDMAVAIVSDWKTGYCTSNPFRSKEMCCTPKHPLQSGSPQFLALADAGENCKAWHPWSDNYVVSFAIYVAWALLFGILAGSVTMTTRANLPAASPGRGDKFSSEQQKKTDSYLNGASGSSLSQTTTGGKTMYMAAGSGIPEIKTILSGFVIPHFLDLKVLVVKAVGSTFAVSTGMCLGKEGPFVHISTCVAYLVGIRFRKYRENSRKLREILAAGCASGLSVAFGAPIGGVLFAYEEISTYFPRKVLWRAFICSLFAAMTLRALNPTGTGKLVLFETNYGTSYKPYHYLVFVLLGVAGGIFGGTFCKANFAWSRTFRKFSVIKNHPVFEVFLVVAVTALTQYPNPLTREPGDVIIKNLLVDCDSKGDTAYVCLHESATEGPDAKYLGYLVYGTLIKLFLTIITFGIKVPSGIIIPALDAGAFFGRLVGQLPLLSSTISPGIFAMVGAGAFLAGVSRMTISLAVIMFELTGELEFIVPNMIGIMVAKWVADALESESVYDLAQTVLGHPFLDLDASMKLVARRQYLVSELIPPEQTMRQITVDVGASGTVQYGILAKKLEQLKGRGLMDAGLVLVQHGGMLVGYLAEGELEYGLNVIGADVDTSTNVRLLSSSHPGAENPEEISSYTPRVSHDDEELDLSPFVDRTPLAICAASPMEYAVEMFGKLGLRYLIVTEEGSGKVNGVIIKKRLVSWIDGLKHEGD